MPEHPLPRPTMKHVVVVVPNAFTLGNLFFGFWAMVRASQGNFVWAAWYVVFAGILDMLDGRIARRMSQGGTRFGAELDSLVDVISFGVAPAFIMYFLEFRNAGRFAWVLCFLYVVAAALRLARFNVQSVGQPSTGWFTGMPSPAAGMTLAVYYPFSQTEWYRRSLAYLDLQHEGLTILMLTLATLMVSNVKYPKWPAIGIRTARGWFGIVVYLAILAGGLLVPEYFLFPLGIAYLLYGLLRAVVLGLLDRGEGEGEPDADHSAPVSLLTQRRRTDGSRQRKEPTE
ncbi:MAG: CDP-diacylglycerol--serine O-phosphatidyltransferase [Gemmatimonadota bacterium]